MAKVFRIYFKKCPNHKKGDPNCVVAKYVTSDHRLMICERLFERTTGFSFNGSKWFKLVEVKKQ